MRETGLRRSLARPLRARFARHNWRACSQAMRYTFPGFFFLTFDWDQVAKNRQHRRKERLNVGNVVKFDSNLFEN